MLYTVKLGYRDDVSRALEADHRVREFVVESEGLFPSEQDLFDKARQQLVTELLIEAANVKPWAISYEVGGERRAA